MPRRRLIAANWKMNPAPAGWDAEGSPYRPREDIDVVVFPSFPDLPACAKAGLVTGGQCARPEPAGAFTGDVSMAMLRAHGCTYVLCGHSEHRKYHRETDEEVLQQVRAAQAAGLTPVLCIGETQDERNAGRTRDVVMRQLSGIVFPVVIAYEPMWAIGTGMTPSPEEAQEVNAFIRSLLSESARAETRILYGGSVTAVNAGGFLGGQNIDGFLVGGASLDPDGFRGILTAAQR